MGKLGSDMEGRLRPLYILQMLRAHTDEDHFLSTTRICEMMKEQYGIEAYRTTVNRDIAALQKAGFGVQMTRSTQNLYNYPDREFDIPEIKLLIDAVQSGKFITRAKSDALTAKLTELAGPFRSRELKRNLAVDGRYKAENEHIYLILDAVNDAINTGRKIRFQMTEYNAVRERVLHNGGEQYVFSPYSLVWDGDLYYAVGWSDKYNAIGSHRVDRIFRRPEVLDDPAVPPPPGFDINEYINTMFRMYNAPRQRVTLKAENRMMGAVVDRFGPDADTRPCGRGCFAVTATVAVGTVFFNWIFGFDGAVTILEPDSVRLEYENRVLKAAMGIMQRRYGEPETPAEEEPEAPAEQEAPVQQESQAEAESAAPEKPRSGRKKKVAPAEQGIPAVTEAPAPEKPRRGRKKKTVPAEQEITAATGSAAPEKPRRGRKKKAAPAEQGIPAVTEAAAPEKPRRGRKKKAAPAE